MSWMTMLYRTYEANLEMAGEADDGVSLSLVAHMTANAQLEVTVSTDGSFLGAREVPKGSPKIIIPVTEASGGRTVGIEPHALCDTLSYLAGDFASYLTDDAAVRKSEQKFEKYLAALQKWNASPYAHEKAIAVHAYLSKKCLISDLIQAGILLCEPDGKLANKKYNGQPYEKVMVCFRVQGTTPSATWQDKTLFASYTDYYTSSQVGQADLCYLTGKPATIAASHPKGIVASNYGAKLISANDTANFVFRGRFETAAQACAVGYEATQKAHSALTWLAARQGVQIGKQEKRTFICWNPNGKAVADVEDPFGLSDDSAPAVHTEPEYQKRLAEALSGYRDRLDDNDDIVVIALDAATTGRLSVTYYNELRGSDFYNRLEHWGSTCNWFFTAFTADNKPYTTIRTPFTRSIVLYAFGTERGKFIDLADKVWKEQAQRIYSCMLDRKPVPFDIVHALTMRASNPQTYASRGNYERLLSIACAMIAKYHNDKNKGEIQLTLDSENCDRSYLFGRLLAVLEAVERKAFSTGETREPNAIRLQSVYVNRPMHTWKVLDGLLVPYFQRISVGSRIYYKNLISEIIGKISAGDTARLNRPLDETYLIGYYLQRAALGKKADNENKEEK